MMTSSTYNYHTTPIGLWNLNCGTVTSVAFLFMAPWSTSHLMPAASRPPSFVWPSTSKTRKIDTTKSNSVKELLENSFPPSTMQDGIRLSVTPTITPSDRRYHIIAPRRPPQSKVASLKSRIRPNRLVLREYPLPSLPRPLRKSTRFPSSSYIQINCSLILLFDTFGRLFHF